MVLSDSTDTTAETSIDDFASGKGVTISVSESFSVSRLFPVLESGLEGKSTRVPSAAIPQALKRDSEI